MASIEVTINGTRLSDMGVSLERGSYAALLLPAPLKNFVENDDPTKDGTQVITEMTTGESVAKIRERDVTLTFLIAGKSMYDFLEKYTAFISLLHKGAVTMYVPDTGLYYHLIYSNSTKFDNYLLNACRLSVKFREPNPANRGA